MQIRKRFKIFNVETKTYSLRPAASLTEWGGVILQVKGRKQRRMNSCLRAKTVCFLIVNIKMNKIFKC